MLTKGLLYRSIDIRTNTTEISADFIIGNANYPQTIPLEKRCPLCILLSIAIFIVLRTIQFDHKFCLCTVKVCNVFSKYLLP